jgi:hypothetical protein
VEVPREFCRLEAAGPRFRQFLAPIVALAPPLLVLDKEARLADLVAMAQSGVYVLFYPTGEVARVGEAVPPRRFRDRLADYERPSKRGCLPWSRATPTGALDFRWGAVLQLDPQVDFFIPALERFLIRELNPPENTLHRRR